MLGHICYFKFSTPFTHHGHGDFYFFHLASLYRLKTFAKRMFPDVERCCLVSGVWTGPAREFGIDAMWA
jgi:hypothetical protein